ncbi:hypothetical protein F4824DRAFT_483087 [Ustulina deusta]|nr:hypothetical protein F4823DRAFT_49748 [Ustulina deusta]KAI3328550.1 hypothetical protein F4824DRAFT_483087 [Ustulina deusta]
MAESHHAEGVITMDSHERKGPAHHNANQTTNETTKDDGPAPSTSLPQALIQEEHIAPAVAPIADNMPHIIEERNPPMVTPLNRLTATPAYIDCPFCKTRSLTRIEKEGDSQQTIASVLCCIFCLCFACIPHLAGWCENVNIFCTSCHTKVAIIPHDGSPIQVLAGSSAYQTESRYQN